MEKLQVSGELSEVEKVDLIDAGFSQTVDNILTRKERKKLRKKGVRNRPKKGHSKKVRKDRSVNRHHLINRCKGGSNHGANIKEMDIKVHAAMHQAFGNKHPHQILAQVLEYCRQVLHPETSDMIIEEVQVLVDYYLKNEEFYNPKAFNSRVFIPKK